ncbi:MAG: LysR family transcriptional regulator [Pararhodobacter sp.]|nr:LysR family transcriptional regulator [Pararhodobacter sp.]
MEGWDEIRTAWHVARAGTVSGAAEALGVHHATVIRHIDALEARLGLKLFQRHGRGYTPTEAGQMLAEAGAETEARLNRLAARLSGWAGGIEGELVVTIPPELASLIVPALAALRDDHPGLEPSLRTSRRVLKLEQGEAHLAIRAGARPDEPDNIVQPLGKAAAALYAAPAYLARHGQPQDEAALSEHRFIGDEGSDSRVPYLRWITRQGYPVVLRSRDPAAQEAAIRAGIGLGFMFPAGAGEGLVQVLPPRAEWTVSLWLVSHVDLHRSAKLQAAMAALKRTLAPQGGGAAVGGPEAGA